jgi:cobaltochelatase CobN
MHLLVRDRKSLDEDAPAQELGQTPAPLVMLSFSDADLGAAAAAWTPAHPPLRLAPLARLRHPMSVDLYIESVAAHARCIIVRLLGGLDYWRYGAEELAALARAKGIALAILPGDNADDTRLRELSNVSAAAWTALDTALREGGAANNALALAWMAHLAGLGPQPGGQAIAVPAHGVDTLDLAGTRPLAAIVFYRSHFLSSDTAPIAALANALRHQGFDVGTLYADSLKSPATAAYVAATLKAWRPTVVLNATAFSARPGAGPSPLDAPGVPVLQLVLSGSGREAWQASSRGLSPTDLAMHVVLPELDGRLLTAAISFKTEQTPHPGLQYARTVHQPDADGIALAAARAAGWSRLARTPRPDRRIAIILSDYPGIGGQQGHAVGLDTFASAEAILQDLNQGQAYSTADITHALCTAAATPFLSLEAYEALLNGLPTTLQAQLHQAWGAPTDDPAVSENHFTLRHLRAGNAVVALQPDRGGVADRRASYHDPDQPPRHAYVAFHLWLRQVEAIHALVHLGTHGSLEWLPGKAAALSPNCWPNALTGGLPVIYPFIVNNPGEAAPAKRRLGAVTIGHLTPPLARTDAHGPARTLERLIDEYATADGLDRKRASLLRGTILDLAAQTGLLAEAGAPRGADPDEALARLDAYLCDVKDLQVRHGLHVYGRRSNTHVMVGLDPTIHAVKRAQAFATESSVCQHSGRRLHGSVDPRVKPENDIPQQTGQEPSKSDNDISAASERAALLAALDGRHIPPGPAGAPSRGRTDVLPTGRNLTTTDPRTVPTRAALTLAERAATALLGRHLAEHGDYPKTVVLDLWGSATMRTGGEDLALAFLLLGATPIWDEGSARVSGFEITPIALLDRPRIDVTLRISGLFRDAFAHQIALFDQLIRAIAARDEAPEWNPMAATPGPRIYGPAPGQYGVGDGTASGYADASSTAYAGQGEGRADAAGLAARLCAAAAFIHTQDHAEQDLLDSPEWAAHEGGFFQAAAAQGANPTLYHLDTSNPDAPKPRTVAEEVRRIVRARAANPAWLAAMMNHARAGAAEIARPLAALEAYARTLPDRFDQQFDLLYDATLANPDVGAFLRTQNPDAHAEMTARFHNAQQTGLWHPKRNHLAAAE